MRSWAQTRARHEAEKAAKCNPFAADALGDRTGSRSVQETHHVTALFFPRVPACNTRATAQRQQQSMQHHTLEPLPEGGKSSFPSAVPHTCQAKKRAQHSMPAHTRGKNLDQQSGVSTELSLRRASSRLFSRRLLFGSGGALGVYPVLGHPKSSLSSFSFSSRETFPIKQPSCEHKAYTQEKF